MGIEVQEGNALAVCCDTCYTFYGDMHDLDRLLTIAEEMAKAVTARREEERN